MGNRVTWLIMVAVFISPFVLAMSGASTASVDVGIAVLVLAGVGKFIEGSDAAKQRLGSKRWFRG